MPTPRATMSKIRHTMQLLYAWLDAPTLADAILDRIVQGAHKIALKGESMRKLSKAA